MKTWQKVELGTVCEFVRNGYSIKQDDQSGGLPITRIETIALGNIDANRCGYAGIESLARVKDYLLNVDDILISHINSLKHLGKCAIYEGEPEALIHGMNLLCLRAKSDKLCPKFTVYLLRSPGFRKQLLSIANQSVNQCSFAVSNFKKLKFSLPPLAEQQYIARVLDQADHLRQQDRQLLAHYDALVQAVFVELFGDPVRNEKEWPVKALSDVVKPDKIVTYGIVQAGPHVETGVPYIKTGDIKNGKILAEGLNKTSKEIAYNYRRSAIATGDIVMSIRATVGTMAIVPDVLHGANLTQGTARISPGHETLTEYLYYFLQSPFAQNWIQKQVKGATFREITLGKLRELQVLLPPLPLQQKFAAIVAQIELQKAAVQQQQAHSEALFQSLLQRAFRGELGRAAAD